MYMLIVSFGPFFQPFETSWILLQTSRFIDHLELFDIFEKDHILFVYIMLLMQP